MIIEIIICKTNKYLIKLLEILKVFLYSILIILIFSSCKKIEKEIEKSQQDLFLEKVNALENSLTSDIDASTLCPIFKLGSDNTDLQRERVVKEIKEKTVIWELQVYEVKSTTKSNIYRIQTGECTPKSESKTVNQLDEMGEEFLKAFRNELGLNSGGNNITNRNVATFIELFAKNEDDIRKINLLKTGDWIKVRGKITGTSFRSIELNPAIFWNDQKTTQLQKNIEDQKSNQVKNNNDLNDINDTRKISDDQQFNLSNISKELSKKLSVPLNKIELSLLVDINGDGIKDYFIEINDSSYCGSGGCLYYSYVSKKLNEFIEFELGNFRNIGLSENKNGQLPILAVAAHGSACQKAGSEPCSGELKWNGSEIVIENYRSD